LKSVEVGNKPDKINYPFLFFFTNYYTGLYVIYYKYYRKELSINIGGITMEKTKSFVITISRQLGSGGAYVGQQVAKQLNVFFADREIINQASKQLKTLEENLESREEKMLTFWHSFFKSTSQTRGVYMAPISPILEFTDEE
jgi:hypothetical protein